MKNDQWDKAFERMLEESNREVAGVDQRWDATFQRLADEWNAVEV